MKKVLLSAAAVFTLVLLYVGMVFFYRFHYVMGPSTGERIDRTTRPNSALLVIDVQEKYTGTGSSRETSAPYINAINSAVDKAFRRKMEVIYISAVREKGNVRQAFFSGDIAVAGSPGAAFDGRLAAVPARIFSKYRADAFHTKEFERYLAERGIGTLYLTGIALEFCVGETAKGALSRGYGVTLIEDAVIPAFASSRKKKLDALVSLGASVISEKEF